MNFKEYIDKTDPELLKKGYQEWLQDASLMDDIFFRKCAEYRPDIVKTIIRVILDDPDLEIDDIHPQKEMENSPYRSIILDAIAKNPNTGQIYNVEVQKSRDEHIEKRARFHSAIIDSKSLLPRQDFKDIPDSIVIFIYSHDILKKNKAVYNITRKTDDNIPFNDGSRIIVLNGAYKGKHRLKDLIEDLKQKDADKLHYQDLSDVVRETKTATYEEDEKMNIFEKVYEDARADALKENQNIMQKIYEDSRKQAVEEKQIEVATNLIGLGTLSVDKIAEVTGLSIDKVNELAAAKAG